MQKKKIVVFTVLSTSLLAVGAFTLLNAKIELSNARADQTNYTLELNSSNSPFEASDSEYQSGSMVLEIANKEDQTIVYSDAKYLADGYLSLKEGGLFYKQEASNSLVSINVTFSGTLKVYSSVEAELGTSYYVSDLSSGVDVSLYGNYWRVVAEADSQITSLVLTYGCETALIPSNTALISSFTTVKDYFASLKQVDGDTYLTFYANTDASYADKQILASELEIREDTITIPCEKVEYFASNKLEAYFNLTSFASTLSDSKDIAPHVFLRNNAVTAYSENGDLRMSTSKGNHKVHLSAYQLDGTYACVLDEIKWNANDAMAYLRFVKIESLASYKTSFTVNENNAYRGIGPWIDDPVITTDGDKTCDPKVPFDNKKTRQVCFVFVSDSDFDIASYGIDMSWNSRWSGSDDIANIFLNENKSTLRGTYNGTAWENGHDAYSVTGGHIHQGVNFITVEGIYGNGESNKANAGYMVQLYGINIVEL